MRRLLLIGFTAPLLACATTSAPKVAPPPAPLQNMSLTATGAAEPLYFLDGRETSRTEVSGIATAKIARVEVLKGQRAVLIYGERASVGVVVVTTKGSPDRAGSLTENCS